MQVGERGSEGENLQADLLLSRKPHPTLLGVGVNLTAHEIMSPAETKSHVYPTEPPRCPTA